MKRAAVLATGPSMSQAVADATRDRFDIVVAVSDAWRLAPWADVLASSDAKWWNHHADALHFKGEKVCASAPHFAPQGVKRLPVPSSTNSGLLGVVAAANSGAASVYLFGFDMRASGHFFGNHPKPLGNPTQERMEVFKRQFAQLVPKGMRVFNCTPGSGLTLYPMLSPEEACAGH